jgi:hypothetical protein
VVFGKQTQRVVERVRQFARPIEVPAQELPDVLVQSAHRSCLSVTGSASGAGPMHQSIETTASTAPKANWHLDLDQAVLSGRVRHQTNVAKISSSALS